MTAAEAAVVRDLRARLRLAEEDIRRLNAERWALEKRLMKRISYLERDKQMALRRAQEATDVARYWQGVVIAKRSAA